MFKSVLVFLFVALIISSLLTGCQSQVIIHPIQDSDIKILKAGETFVVEKDGYFLSKFYMAEVIDAVVRK